MTLIITGTRQIERKLTLLETTPFLKKMLSEIGMFVMRTIKKRTLAGQDVDELTFAPYSFAYEKQRAKAGFPVRPVDLTRSGSMLSSMNYDVEQHHVDIFFMNTTDPKGVRNPAKAFFLNKDREFFAVSKTEVKRITKIVEAYYYKSSK